MTSISPNRVHETLRRTILADGFDVVLDLEKSRGCRLVDARDGQEYIDMFSCFASLTLGFNHPAMRRPEVVERLGKVAVQKPSNSDLYSSEMATFVDTFRQQAMPPAFKHAFFISGGALGVENALKAAFDYKVQKNFKKRGDHTTEVGTKVVHFRNAFHGRTGYTLSLTNTLPDKIRYFPKFPWPRFDTPAMKFPFDERAKEGVAREEARILDEIRQLGKKEGDDIAAVIIEPIQGEGGDVHFRKEFFAGLRQICDEFDWMLIFDEVQTGFGMTGKMWVHEHFGVTPDMVCFGKKSQICGFMATDRIDQLETNVFKIPSRINSTWGGSLVDMVRCTLQLEILQEEKILQHVEKQGALLLGGLQRLAEDFPGKISSARGRGLMCAFDLPDDATRKAFLTEVRKAGVMILPCGPRSVRFRPALTVQTQDINETLGRIGTAVAKI